VPKADAAFGVISDIDDTMMETGAYSLWRNIWTSLTGNALTRTVFEDAKQLMSLLQDNGRNPIFFVSSSPWNLHGFLDEIFARAGLPKAPKFLRDYGISDTQFITGTHGDHKGGAIDQIMAANPDLPFTLIGDTGQHDAHVYRDAIERHPGRVQRVILRAPGAGADADDLGYVSQIKDLGVPVLIGPDYTEAIAALRASA
jgi:phosphatidate phosphatase APP1